MKKTVHKIIDGSVVRTGEEAIEFELLIRVKSYELKAIQEAYKEQLSLLKENRDKLVALFDKGVRQVVYNGAEWEDVQTGLTILDLQSLEQTVRNNPQIELDFTAIKQIEIGGE